MRKKLLLLNDTTNWYHFGCTATSLAMKETIMSLGYKLTSYPITETYKFSSSPNNVKGFKDEKNFRIFKENNSALIIEIEKNEIIIINGEGTLHGIRPAPLSLLYIAYVSKTFLNKHVEIINHSVYPQDDLLLDNLAITDLYKLVYNMIDFAAIREPLSKSLADKLNITSTLSFDCMPIYIKSHYKPHNRKDNKTLLIAGSATWLHLNILSNEIGNINEYKLGLSEFISYINIMSEKGYDIQFLYSAIEYPAKDDREFIAYIEQRLSKPWTILQAKSLSEWFSHIESATILVSGRFHHSIAAACLKTDFIALNSNTPKIEGMLQALNYNKIFNYKDENLANKLLEFTGNIQHECKNITSIEILVNKAHNNFLRLEKFT